MTHGTGTTFPVTAPSADAGRPTTPGMRSATATAKPVPSRGLARVLGLVCIGALPLAACDTTVVNPGPIEDEFLNNPLAYPAMVNGMGRAFAQGLNYVGYTSAAVAREIHPAGSTGSFGITNLWAAGELDATDTDLDTHWEESQRARWLAESGIARINPDSASADLLAQAYLWAGYANRLLGEMMCEAVIDGAAPESHTLHLTKAEEWFTKAAEVGSDSLAMAGIAGRASVRVHLDKWAEAVADASQVPADFAYSVPYFSIGVDDQRNRIAWASMGTPYKAHTVWDTPYEGYGLSEDNPDGDPRVAYEVTDDVGDAAIQCCGQVPFLRQRKYADDGAPIRLSSGFEMKLIRAEAMLRDGQVDGAIGLINEVRAAAGVDPVSAGSTEEAWTRLKRERGIELWLEGRRLGDLRRWADAGTPGALHPLEQPSGDIEEGSHLREQDLCFPIAPTEQDTNPNVPKAGL